MKRTLLPALFLTTGIISSTYYFAVFMVVLAYLVYLHRGMLPRGALRFVAPLGLVVAAGLVGIDTDDIRSSLRDLWYFSKIFLIALSGLLIGFSYSIDPRFLRRLTAVALILAFFNIGYAVLGPDAEGSRYLSYLAALLVPFLWRYRYSRGFSAGVMRLAVTAPAIVMLALSGSRAGLLTFAISWFAARGIFNRKSNAVLVFGTGAALALVIWPMLPQYDAANITFLGKIQNSINELSFETGEDRLEMYVNWRGFEAFSAYQTWLKASLFEQIFGLGLGASIDLGRVVAYGSGEVESLPFVHNAYFTLLVKTGLIGIAAMVYFLLAPFRISFDRTNRDAVVFAQLSRGAAIVLLLTIALIAGPLNKQSMDGVLLIWAWSSGALIRLRRQAESMQNYKETSYTGNATAVGRVKSWP